MSLFRRIGLQLQEAGVNTVLDLEPGAGLSPKQKAPYFRTGLCNFGSSTWARTRDLRINSPALYQLSYRGIVFLLSRFTIVLQ